MSAARDILLDRFRWVDGHADVWRVFRDPVALRTVVGALAAPFSDAGVTAVAGVESRGFLLGGAVAIELGVGFIAIRKAGALFPGAKASALTAPDYRRKQTELLLQRMAIDAHDRILLVDDWIETGSQALAVARLIAECGGRLIGVSVLVDQASAEIRPLLPPIHGIVSGSELPGDESPA